jgi:hypothetical protein
MGYDALDVKRVFMMRKSGARRTLAFDRTS